MKTIELTRGFVATISDEDEDRVSQFLWQVCTPKGYAYATRSYRDGFGSDSPVRKMYLSAFILGQPARHKDGDTLNCTRENLVPY